MAERHSRVGGWKIGNGPSSISMTYCTFYTLLYRGPWCRHYLTFGFYSRLYAGLYSELYRRFSAGLMGPGGGGGAGWSGESWNMSPGFQEPGIRFLGLLAGSTP